jgi:hypothetical protein
MATIFELPIPKTTVSTIDAAATLTTAQTINGLILSTPTAARAHTTPTATELLTALDNKFVGASFELNYRNTSAGAYAITLTAGTGVTVTGTATVAQNATATFLAVVTDVATPAITFYRVGTGTV